MKWSLGPAPTKLISGFSLDPSWLIWPRKLPRCSRNGNHFSIGSYISPPPESGGSIACGLTETIPSYGSPEICVLTSVILDKRHSHWQNQGKLRKQWKLAKAHSYFTRMCAHRALSQKEDYITLLLHDLFFSINWTSSYLKEREREKNLLGHFSW